MKQKQNHASDCAVHNGPAMAAGECDCGANPSPCPFCGNEKIEALYMSHGGVSAFCYECEAEGPPRSTEAEAMESWNRRSQSAQAQRAPLTDAEIESATGSKQGTPLFLAAKAFTIAIERAHGITQDKK